MVAEGDVTELVERLTSYSDSLGRHIALIQQAFDRMQQSFAHLKRVWHGEAAENFYADFAQTVARTERVLETGRRIKMLLDDRLEYLRAADRPMGGGYAGSPQQLPIRFPVPADEAREMASAQGFLRSERRRDGIPLYNEQGGERFTRTRLDIGGRSLVGKSEGPKEIYEGRVPHVTYQAMKHAEAHAIYQAIKEGVSADTATLYIDRSPCGFCRLGLPGLARWLGVRKLKVVTPDGVLGEY